MSRPISALIISQQWTASIKRTFIILATCTMWAGVLIDRLLLAVGCSSSFQPHAGFFPFSVVELQKWKSKSLNTRSGANDRRVVHVGISTSLDTRAAEPQRIFLNTAWNCQPGIDFSIFSVMSSTSSVLCLTLVRVLVVAWRARISLQRRPPVVVLIGPDRRVPRR